MYCERIQANISPREAAVTIVQFINSRDQHVAILALNVQPLYYVITDLK
jgi:hypothetical protein